MKNLVKIVLVSFLFSLPAFADSAAIGQLTGLGMSPELASTVDSLYSSAISASEIPKTTNTIDLGSASKIFRGAYIGSLVQPFAVITPAATPVNTVAPLSVIPTFAANGGVLMPQCTPGATGPVVYNKGANTTLLWPQSSVGGTPTPGAILGFGTPVAAGTPALLPTGKRVDCGCDNTNTFYCNMGS